MDVAVCAYNPSGGGLGAQWLAGPAESVSEQRTLPDAHLWLPPHVHVHPC